MLKVLGTQTISLANIPINHPSKYGRLFSGCLNYENGCFGFYISVNIIGSDGKPIDRYYEFDECFSVSFQEMPCDENGNIVLENYEFTKYQSHSGDCDGQNFVQIFFFCNKEPTHRVNLLTGSLTSNAEDRQYIRDIDLSYILSQR